MASQFRLLRMLESRLHDGDLCNIDALLGCPLYYPRQDVFDKFESLSQKEQHAALSCLFFTINWFRELINAFVTQKDKDLKRKLYGRLRQVIELEQMLWQKLPKCPNYTPPLAVFDLDTSMLSPSLKVTNKKKGQRGRKPAAGKAKKGKGNVNENTRLDTQANSQVATPATPQPTATAAGDKAETTENEVASAVDPSSCRPFFRELHFDVFGLLFRKLSVDVNSKPEGLMTIAELEFLLTDLNMKLSHMFTGGKRAIGFGDGASKNIGYSHLDIFTAAEVAGRAHSYLKPVCVHLEAISFFFQSLIADNDGIVDAPVIYSDQTRPLMSVNTLLFNTLSIFLSWPGLQKEESKGTLTAVLRTIAKRLEGDSVNTMEQDELTSVTFKYLSKFHESVVNIDAATTLVQALVALTAFPCVDNLYEKLVEVTEELLKREWYKNRGEKEKGSSYNQNIVTLLEIYLKYGSNTLQLVYTLCTVGFAEFTNASGRDPHSDTFPTLNKGTMSIYYRCMMCSLVTGTKKNLSLLGSASDADRKKYMEVWSTAINIFSVLITTLKNYDSKGLLGPSLKYSRCFLELFLRSAMPVLDSSLRMYNQEVMVLLKNMQSSTRLLQHVCTHSKVNQDTSLTRYVPPLKRCLETLVYRVKTMLVINKCSQAFWLGNLKNRDLQGEELLTQAAREDSEGEDDEQQPELNDDEQSDVDLEVEECERGNSSSSNSLIKAQGDVSSNYEVSY
ncbi:Fanconi anemia group D2 protein [Halocaridina rubra]|uniref:Fanconi anemia group D2 protein n=1 Tax=Halocaridina rubra TaxID=373956 RepID=A0AAN9ABH5_HALRR